MRVAKLASGLALAVLLLTGCGWKGYGTIVAKTHNDAYYTMHFQCGSFDSKGMCNSQIPIQDYVPEYWGYKVRDSKGDLHEVGTSKSDWVSHNVGDSFDNTDKKS